MNTSTNIFPDVSSRVVSLSPEVLPIAIDAGSYDTKIFNFISSQFISMDNSLVKVRDINEDLSMYFSENGNLIDNLDITITKINGEWSLKEQINGRFLLGKMAQQYSPRVIKPNNLIGKSYQITTYVSILTAIALQAIETGMVYTKPILGVLLPPIEVFNNNDREMFIRNLEGVFKVKFNQFENIEVTIKLSKDNIIVKPECLTGMITFIYNNDGTVNKEALKYRDGYILAVDIGAATTDVVAVKNFNPIKHSLDTFRQGANKINALFIEEIAKTYNGYKPSPMVADEAMHTCELVYGNKKFDVSFQVKEARRKFAESLYETFMINYFQSKEIHPIEISGLVMIGGGNMPSVDNKVPLTGEYISEYLSAICPNIEPIFLDNPRLSNIIGLVKYMNSIEWNMQ